MKMIKTFSREELYEEIWEISAKQVSLKYDLSYSDLLKKCKEFEIPIPMVVIGIVRILDKI